MDIENPVAVGGEPEAATPQIEGSPPSTAGAAEGSPTPAPAAAPAEPKLDIPTQPPSIHGDELLEKIRANLGATEKGAPEVNEEPAEKPAAVSDKAPKADDSAADGEASKAPAAADPVADKAGRFDRFIDYVSQRGISVDDLGQTIEATAQLRQAGLSKDEVSDGLQIIALSKTNPGKALDLIRPYIHSWMQQSGAALSADLRQKVDDGYLTEDDARELSRLRAEREQHASDLAARDRAEQTRSHAQLHAHLGTTLQAWFDKWGQIDADATNDQKRKEVSRRLLLALRDHGSSGGAMDAATVHRICDQQLADVDALIKAVNRTPPRARATAPKGGGSNVPLTAPRPKDSMEALMRGLRATH